MVTKVVASGSRSVAHLSATLLADLSFGDICVRCDLGKVLVCKSIGFTPVTQLTPDTRPLGRRHGVRFLVGGFDRLGAVVSADPGDRVGCGMPGEDGENG